MEMVSCNLLPISTLCFLFSFLLYWILIFSVSCLLVSLTARLQVSCNCTCNCTCCMWPCRSRASIYACLSYDLLFLEFHSVLASLSFPFLVCMLMLISIQIGWSFLGLDVCNKPLLIV